MKSCPPSRHSEYEEKAEQLLRESTEFKVWGRLRGPIAVVLA